MKYMLLIYNNPAAYDELPATERDGIFTDVDAIMAELMASGEWVAGEGLVDGSRAKTVRVRDGVPAVTDGPFVEMKEVLAGYLTVDCETEERAVEIAARWPDARYFAMEVRALMGSAADDV